MKIPKSIHILIILVLTFIGLFIGLIHSIETAPYRGENTAILWVLILNGLFIIPFTIICLYNRNQGNIVFPWIFFMIIIMIMVFNRFYITSFDSNEWKSELDYSRIYDKNPAHTNGNMIEDIISNRLLIGLSKEEVINQLGKNYFQGGTYGIDSAFYYFYSGGGLYNGCDKLEVLFENGKCIDTRYAGCD